MPSRMLAAVDRYQRTHRRLGFPIAAVYRFSDDQGPYLAALITYYGFCRCFPCSCAGDGSGYRPGRRSAPPVRADRLGARSVPVIGAQLGGNVHSLSGSGLGLAVARFTMIYGCLGAAGTTQNAFNRAWAVPRNRRPHPVTARLRSLLMLLVLGAGVLVTTVLAGLTTGAGAYGADVGRVLRLGAVLLAVVANRASAGST
jgi:membrane protein